MSHIIVNETAVQAGLDSLGEPRLDTRIALEATGGPEFGNLALFNSVGQRKSVELWPRDLRSWTINFVVRWDAKNSDNASLLLFKKLLAFWRVRRGDSRPFRFKDWTDYEDDGQGKVVLRNGVYRLVKQYVDDFTEEVYTLPIFKPVPTTVTLVGCTGTVNFKTGVVNNCSGPGTWTGQYDIWSHFTSTKFEARATPGGVVSWNGVALMEDFLDESDLLF